MHLINNQPWIDLSESIDVSPLVKRKADFARIIACYPSMIFTSLVGMQDNLFDQELIDLGDFAKKIINDPLHPDHHWVEKVGLIPRFYTFCKFMYPVVSLNQAMYIRTIKEDSYGKKHLRSSCIDTPITKEFCFLFDWIDSQAIFEQYGRVVLFINEPGVATVRHRDYPNPNSHRNEFIWLTLDDRKKFYIYDETTDIKNMIGSPVACFDNANWHGSDPSPYASWSLRIDGVFSDDFLKRSKMHEHFRR